MGSKRFGSDIEERFSDRSQTSLSTYGVFLKPVSNLHPGILTCHASLTVICMLVLTRLDSSLLRFPFSLEHPHLIHKSYNSTAAKKTGV